MDINIETLEKKTGDALPRSRRGALRYSTNPFVAAAAANSQTGTKRLSNKKGDRFMIISEQGEPIGPAGFHQVIDVDKTQFIKLYVNGVKAFMGLGSSGSRVFELIYRAVQKVPGKDKVHIHFLEIDQIITPISRATFNRGMTELLTKGFLAESTTPGMYFLNIDYLFNGNRLAFIKEYRITSASIVIEEAKKAIELNTIKDDKTVDWVDLIND